MSRALLIVLALCLTALPAAATAAPAPVPQTTVNDVEDEVMCPICGTLLELADSPQAMVTAVCSVRARSASASSHSGGQSTMPRS